MDDGGGLWDLVRRILGWGKDPDIQGPPRINTADLDHVVKATEEVTRTAERSERAVKEFARKQQRELDRLKERVAHLTAEVDVLRRESS